MKQRSAIFLQGVIILTGVTALAVMIRFPLTEGRAVNLDLFSIYSDPFILYCYTASVPFFIALYKAFRLLGNFRQNNAFSQNSVMTLRSIKYCAFLLSILIVTAGLYIILFHNKDDDPAGFVTVSIITFFISLTIAAAAFVFEKILQEGMDLKSEYRQI